MTVAREMRGIIEPVRRDRGRSILKIVTSFVWCWLMLVWCWLMLAGMVYLVAQQPSQPE